MWTLQKYEFFLKEDSDGTWHTTRDRFNADLFVTRERDVYIPEEYWLQKSEPIGHFHQKSVSEWGTKPGRCYIKIHGEYLEFFPREENRNA